MTWPTIRLRRHFLIVNGGTPTSDSENWDGAIPWATPSDLARVDGSILEYTDRTLTDRGLANGSRVVPAGCLLISIRAPIGYVAETKFTVAFNQGCRGLVPTQPMSVPYFRYQIHSLVDRLVAAGQGSTFVELSGDALASLPVMAPPLSTQTVIADYLDRETARIDALIAAKRRMVALLEERWQGVLEASIQSLVERYGANPLKYTCREIVVGIVVTPSKWYAESGVPAIRGTNVSPGAIALDDLVYLTPEGHALHPKSQLRSGDVVIVRTGQAGEAALVPPELVGSNCIDLVIVRPKPDYLPSFLEYVLNSDWMQKHIREHSVGTIQSHFNVGAASLTPVPVVPYDEQVVVSRKLHGLRAQITEAANVLDRQIQLLKEHRKALVAAAVTGQFDVSKREAPVAA